MNEFDRLTIETPENLALDAPIAGFGTRCIAALLDYLIIFALIVLFTLTFFNRSRVFADPVTAAFYVLALFLLTTFYHLVFEIAWNGQSPGKRWMRLRVVQANGSPLTVTGALLRNFLRLFDFLPVFYGIGLVALFVSSKGQRLGDLAAGTIVIIEQKSISLDSLKASTVVKYRYFTRYTPLPEYIHTDGLTEQNRQLIINFLNRRDTLTDTTRIAIPLARQMAEKIGLTDLDVSRDPRAAEVFLEQLARAFELNESE